MKRIAVKTTINPYEYKQALEEEPGINNKLNQALLKVTAMNLFEAGLLNLSINEVASTDMYSIPDLEMTITTYAWDVEDHFTFLKLFKELKHTELTDKQLSLIQEMQDILTIEC